MITLKCDNCDKSFEIEDDAAGEKAACPYCGDINRVPVQSSAPASAGSSAVPIGRVPETPPASAPASRAAVAAPSDAERTIAVVRQAMFRAHPFWYSLMVLVFLGGIVLAVLGQTSQQFASMRWMAWLGLGLSAAALIWWIIWWAAPHRWIKLTITNKRTIRQEGIVVRKTSEVLHNHIRNVKIEQSFLERILGVGSLSIDSAGGSEDELIEIHMKHVPQPYRVKEIFDRYRRM
jgi:membrane protein YdbS with pleckstrin-like domain